MYKKSRILAIIPARIGSKRLPKKNIKPLKGKPLVYWSISAALKSKYIDNVVVSTDSSEIAEISKEYGASVPFLRPKELAVDNIRGYYALKHTVNFYKENLNQTYDYIISLQPTTPLRTANDIDEAIEYMFQKNADAIVSVCEVEHSMNWINTLPESFDMSSFLSEDVKCKRSQELEKHYRLNGAIYISRTDKLMENESFFLKENIFAYEMPSNRSIDIDNIIDLKLAEVLMDELKEFNEGNFNDGK